MLIWNLSDDLILDLHGLSAYESSYLINDFLKTQSLCRKEYVQIIHGSRGSGILANLTREILKTSKYVEKYSYNYTNLGSVIVKLKHYD